MITYLYRSVRDDRIRKVAKPKRGTWLFAYDLSAEDVQQLCRYGFDADLLDDATDYFEVPRFEYVDGTMYLFTRFPVDGNAGELSTAPLLIAISDTYLLTVSHTKPEFLDDYAHGRRSLITTQKIKALLIILDTIVHQYERSLMSIRRTLIQYFGKIENVSDADLKQLLVIESRLADYLSALIPTFNALVGMLGKRSGITLHQDDVDILEDLNQDIHQSIDTARGIAKTAQNIRSAHDVIIGHQLNATVKTLTALTIIFTIPTIMTGLFGMNTWLPFSQGPQAFFGIIAITSLLALALALFFTKKNWL